MEPRSSEMIPLGQIAPPSTPSRRGIDPDSLGGLADSMAAEGLHQPIGLRDLGAGAGYELIWGHRRFLAAHLLGWAVIEAKLFPIDYDPDLARVSENLNREELTPIEEAHEVQRFVAKGQSHAAIARLFRVSPSWVAARVHLLTLPLDVQDAIHAGTITLGVGAALGQVDHDGYRRELLDEAARTGATARVAEVWTAHYQADKARIVSNHLTVGEIIEARQNYVIKWACESCHAEVPYPETRAWRFCASCSATIADAVRDADQPVR